MILKLNASLYFGNCEQFKDKLLDMLNSDIKYVILYMGGVHSIDTTTIDVLIDLSQRLNKKDIGFIMTDVNQDVRRKIKITELEYLVTIII